MNEPIFTAHRGDPTGAVLVDFTADWCPPCRAISPILDDIADERADTLDVVRLDVDEHPDVTSHHAVSSMPTLVLFVAGDEVARLVGAHPKRSIDQWLDQALDSQTVNRTPYPVSLAGPGNRICGSVGRQRACALGIIQGAQQALEDPRCGRGAASIIYDAVSFLRAPTADRPSRVFTIAGWAIAAASAVLVLGVSSSVSAHSVESTGPTATMRHVADESAPAIGLIGDSTLSGVRWFEHYGELERFNFVFDAESCRRTVERSCWSREQYRPRNALTALQDEAGDWGEVLVVMTGYNDSAAGFAEGVTAVVDEAKRQGISAVIWLSLRTKGVDYEEPLHLANGSTYRDANRSLYEIAGELNGYLQIADWATHSADSPEWFESDGAHLAEAGATALTEFIADQVDGVLTGGTITRTPPPWEEVRDGDEGELVVAVQRALIDADLDENIVDDGIYGPQTVSAVAEFQRTSGLIESGAVDEATAAALGLYDPPAPTTTSPAPSTTSAVMTAPTTMAAAPDVVPQVARREGLPDTAWWMAVLAVAGSLWIARRRRSTDLLVSTAATFDPREEFSDDLPVGLEAESAALYDHADEHDGLRRTPDVGR